MSSFSNPSLALPTSQLILQPFRCFTYVTGTSRTRHLANRPCIGGRKNSLRSTSLLQQVTKFRSSYSFGQLLRILLRAVSSNSSFNNHKALYFVKYFSRAAQNSPEGRMRLAGRGLKTPGIQYITKLPANYRLNFCEW